MFDTLTLILRTYTRAFLSQGVGVIGLAWCLAEGQAGFAVALTILVLIDQAIFLRGRFGSAEPYRPGHRFIDGWCVAVSLLDILICFAAIVRSAGLIDSGTGSTTSSPLDCLAYVLAAFAHGTTTLAPATAAGRLAGAVLAALGMLAFLAGLMATTLRIRRPG